MKITPVNAPSMKLPTGTSPTGAEARQRAIDILNKNSPGGQGHTLEAVIQQQAGASEATPPPSTEPVEAAPQTASPAVAKAAAPAPEASAQSTEAKPQETPLSSQYAQLARKEKALRAQMQEFKAQQDAFKAQQEALQAKESEYQSKYIPRDRLKAEALKVLNEEGITYDQLTQQALSSPQSQSEMQLLSEIKALKSELQGIKGEQENVKKSQVQQQEQAYKQAVAQIRRDTQRLVESDPSFEMIKESESVDDVVELIEKEYKDTGILLTVEEAAKAIEDELTERVSKLARLGKISQRLAPPPAPATAKQPEAPKAAPAAPQMKTLTNNVGSQRPMSRRERAIAAFEGKLQK